MRWTIHALAGLALVIAPLTACRDDDEDAAIQRYEERAPAPIVMPGIEPAAPSEAAGSGVEPEAVAPAEAGDWAERRAELRTEMSRRHDRFAKERDELMHRIGVDPSDDVATAEDALRGAFESFNERMSALAQVTASDFAYVADDVRYAAREVEQCLTDLRELLTKEGAPIDDASHEGMPERNNTGADDPTAPQSGAPEEGVAPPASPQPRPME